MSICATEYVIPSEEQGGLESYPAVPAILPGTVCVQYVRCGKPSCICRSGKLHGPYHYRVWHAGGIVQKVYVRPEDVPAVMEACAAYGELSRTLRRMRRELQTVTEQLEKDMRRSRRMIARRSFLPAARSGAR